jgi:putative CocE/NonD family hydrolase
MDFSSDSVVDNKALHLAFFDHYLKKVTSKFDFPRARIYVTGLNRWRSFDQYPPADARFRSLYLHSGGRANSAAGDGRLSWDSPSDEPSDGYTFDPRNPVPSKLNGEDLPLDHRPIERRDDVLVYTSDPLAARLEVVGRSYVELFAASDARDTDFTAKILDVYPDGRAVKLGTLPTGVIRARYRNGLELPELLTPGKPEKFRIELFDFAHAFLPGHKVRVEISSSAYPFIAPNQNTGNHVATDTEWRSARQTVFHDRARPSHVALPVMPNR